MKTNALYVLMLWLAGIGAALAQANSIPLVNCNPGQVCIQNQGGSATTNGTGTSRTFSLSGATVTVIGSMIQPAGPPG